MKPNSEATKTYRGETSNDKPAIGMHATMIVAGDAGLALMSVPWLPAAGLATARRRPQDGLPVGADCWRWKRRATLPVTELLLGSASVPALSLTKGNGIGRHGG